MYLQTIRDILTYAEQENQTLDIGLRGIRERSNKYQVTSNKEGLRKKETGYSYDYCLPSILIIYLARVSVISRCLGTGWETLVSGF
jgi:hypothetical protein